MTCEPGKLAVYVIGPPGVGKTTLVDALLTRLGARERVQVEAPVPHVLHPPTDWVEVGRWRPAFGGTDALGYAIMPKAVAWVTGERRPRLLIGEGDRLASDRFFDALTAGYEELLVIHLAGVDVAWERAQARAASLGRPPQNEGWWKGRATKAQRLAGRYAGLELDASLNISHLVAPAYEAIFRRL